MFKVVLLLLLIASCGSMGLLKASTYSRRVRELNDIRSLLHQISMEINFRREPLPVIFRNMTQNNSHHINHLMAVCIKYMEEKIPFEKCWNTAINDVYKDSCLNKEDLYILNELGNQLGKSNVTGQENAIKLTEEKLMYQISQASESRKTKGKMYGSLGFSVGLVIAVILI